ncbi:MAG TPA: acyl-CoA dehydrogenase family protein [Candidatus Thermoplasmatota archaeon]|nr:acyl-CoA dehydrogenase family protein [Candidatus Thermoplasmatota archaeon]
MPFTLSEDEQLIQKTVREFAQAITLEKAADFDRHDRFPAAVLGDAAGLGLLQVSAPGSPLGATSLALAADELAQVCPNSAAALIAHNAAQAAILDGETVPWTDGLVALLVAEEATGSDHSSPGTTATPTDDGFKVTGQKVWGINAAVAKHFLVLASVPGAGPTLLHIPSDAPGVSLGENESLMGLRAAGIRTVYLSGVAVPKSAALGGPGGAPPRLQRALTWLQLGAAAALCGCVAGGLEAAARFAETRIQFGQPVGTYQAVSDGLTTVDIQLAAARALVLQAAARATEADAHVWAARAKAFAAEMAIPMTRQAIRVQGGTGFMREGGTERFARDARALQFVGQTSQMQRDTLKRHVMPNIVFPATP